MQYTFTDNFLLLMADLADFNMRVRSINKSLPALIGDPRFQNHRQWMKRCLQDKRSKNKINSILHALKAKGFLKIIKSENTQGYFLTPKGEFRSYCLKAVGAPKNKLPDNQWLMVFFDIPENFRKGRDIFRGMLKALGFEQFQKSIWITPYNVISEIKMLIKEYEIEKYVKFLLVKEFL